jgi:tetratricopeptide (TPR) repeat protein
MNPRQILAFAVLAPLTLFGLYRCTYMPVRCSVVSASVERQLLAAMNRNDEYAGIVTGRQVQDTLRDCVIHPLQIDPPLLTALSYRMTHQYRHSIEWYERALTIDRRPEIYFGLGMTQLKANRRAEAMQNLTRAVAFDPMVLDGIDDGAVRDEVKRRVIAQYGADWLPPGP